MRRDRLSSEVGLRSIPRLGGFGRASSRVIGCMNASRSYGHRVIGAVHEVTVRGDSPEDVADAVQHELDECRAARIVVDITDVHEATEEVVVALGRLAEDADRSAVRVSEDDAEEIEDALSPLGVTVITERSAASAGRAGSRVGLAQPRVG